MQSLWTDKKALYVCVCVPFRYTMLIGKKSFDSAADRMHCLLYCLLNALPFVVCIVWHHWHEYKCSANVIYIVLSIVAEWIRINPVCEWIIFWRMIRRKWWNPNFYDNSMDTMLGICIIGNSPACLSLISSYPCIFVFVLITNYERTKWRAIQTIGSWAD